MLMTPAKIPADPRPATALPIMKALELGAEAHTVDYKILVESPVSSDGIDIPQPRRHRWPRAKPISANKMCRYDHT